MPPRLREVVDKVLDAGNMTQAELALKLYGSEKKQSTLSIMLSAADDSDWEKHWQACARLLPLAIALGVLTERDLLDLKQQHGAKHVGPKKNNDGAKTGRSTIS